MNHSLNTRKGSIIYYCEAHCQNCPYISCYLEIVDKGVLFSSYLQCEFCTLLFLCSASKSKSSARNGYHVSITSVTLRHTETQLFSLYWLKLASHMSGVCVYYPLNILSGFACMKDWTGCILFLQLIILVFNRGKDNGCLLILLRQL